MIDDVLRDISPNQPVLIAGPTASGKSALALAIAEAQGGVVVNADASQVFDCWQVISARPSPEEVARAPHLLYGHLPYDAPYSVGHWLRELEPILNGRQRPIVVGGTGLYFSALTEGLSEIPEVPADIRSRADALTLPEMLAGLDAATASQIDTANRARVQRAWEVLTTTGAGLITWQGRKTAPLLRPETTKRIVIDAPKAWLTPRIERRFQAMIAQGALEEVRAMAARYDPGLPAFRAIGVPELIRHLRGTLTLEQACDLATIATRQYAKRQRTWFRKRCDDWLWLPAQDLS